MFDDTTTTITTDEMSAADAVAEKISLYKKRREDAVALWATIPADQIDLWSWATCAVGWLGRMNHDGWHSDCCCYPYWQEKNSCPSQISSQVIKYFGLLSYDIGIFTVFYYYKCKNSLTAEELISRVSDNLLAAPYDI